MWGWGADNHNLEHFNNGMSVRCHTVGSTAVASWRPCALNSEGACAAAHLCSWSSLPSTGKIDVSAYQKTMILCIQLKLIKIFYWISGTWYFLKIPNLCTQISTLLTLEPQMPGLHDCHFSPCITQHRKPKSWCSPTPSELLQLLWPAPQQRTKKWGGVFMETSCCLWTPSTVWGIAIQSYATHILECTIPRTQVNFPLCSVWFKPTLLKLSSPWGSSEVW